MSRPCRYTDDQTHVVDLLIAYRAATGVRAYPTSWRLRLLWSSRVWEPSRDARLWEDENGRATGFAMLWRRRRKSPYLVFDRVVHPEHVTDALVDAMTAWGTQRAGAIAQASGYPITLFMNQPNPAVHPDRDLEAYDFTPSPPDPDQYNVYLARSLETPLPEPSPPAGYTLRPLHSLDELATYDALYDFAEVDAEHRRESFASDEYVHLVAVDVEGDFAAYCECAICRAEWRRTGQRLGWIDYIGVQPEKQRRGLGRAILLAGLHQLRAWGTKTSMVVTLSTNTPALALYRSAGFAPIDVPTTVAYKKT